MAERRRFTYKHVLVTGGARGIGLEIAQQFAVEGAILSIFDLNRLNLDSSAESLRQKRTSVYTYEVDVADSRAVQKAVAIAESVAPIDV
ncbi:MAG TPA: SDR family NAD(P)-dependent oxidoreductase, partial [Chryseolinea sp.]|nr:SDR family NAD(P)-dependent oxidoreductase [Chryseolinea sp.]